MKKWMSEERIVCLGHLKDTRNFSEYLLTKVIGAGSHGSVFTCTNGKSIFTVKVFDRIHDEDTGKYETLHDYMWRFQQELMMNLYLRSQLRKSPVTAKDVQYFAFCIHSFYEYGEVDTSIAPNTPTFEAQPIRAAMVFPHHNALDLFDFSAFILPKAPSQFLQWRCTLLIAEMLCRAVSAMHIAQVYHRDLKLTNVIIFREDERKIDSSVFSHIDQLRIQIVDFGLSTTIDNASAQIFCEKSKTPINRLVDTIGDGHELRIPYLTSACSADPRTKTVCDGKEKLIYFSRNMVVSFFPFFETFAVATMIQHMFDLDTLLTGISEPHVAFRETVYMPPRHVCDVFAILQQMSGDMRNRRNLLVYAEIFASFQDKIVAHAAHVDLMCARLEKCAASSSRVNQLKNDKRRLRSTTYPISSK
jgi:serine/threonine protein kinase